MALTDAEKLQCKMLLGIPANFRADFAGNDPNQLLDGVTAVQETEVRAILTSWSTIKLDADRIKAEGLDSDPERTEEKLRGLLALAIGYRRPNKTIGGIRLMRG